MSENNGFSASSIFLAFILGGVVGAGITLLLAPQSGKETREKIKNLADDLKEKVTSTVEHGKEIFEEKKSLLSTAVEAGKEAYEREKEKHSH